MSDVTAYHPLKASEVEPFNPQHAVQSLIPDFTNPRKTDYLTYKAMGFSNREAEALAGIDNGSVRRWRKEDPKFIDWEERVHNIRVNVTTVLLESQFSRNMHLAMQLDFKLLRKAMFAPNGVEDLTDAEQKLLARATDRYKASDLLAFLKVIEPQRDQGGLGGDLNLTVNVNGEAVVDVHAKKAAARQLLDDFMVNQDAYNVIEGEIIDHSDAAS